MSKDTVALILSVLIVSVTLWLCLILSKWLVVASIIGKSSMKLSPLSFEAFIACTFLVAWIIFAQKFVLSHITRSYGKGK
jgi:hypothetical protein